MECYIFCKNIILEPCSKNTSPCILLSSLYLKKLYQDANVICISSDSYIKDETLAAELIKDSSISDSYDLNGHNVSLKVERV